MAGFDKFMVQVSIGTNRKLRRLPVVQRWAYVAGVLPLAAQSPLRGALLIADGEPATADDVAKEATIQLKDARAALQSLRGLGMLERDADGVEWVHDWDQYNRDPKPSDSPEATRARKRAQRNRQRRHADVTRDSGGGSRGSHAPEVEEEVEGTEQEERARLRTGAQRGVLHPQIVEVLDVLQAVPSLIVEPAAVSSACRAHAGCDPVAAAHVVASWMHAGQMQIREASVLMNRALDRQRTDAEVRATKIQRATSAPVRSAGRVSAAEQAAALRAEADAEEAARRDAA